MQSPDYICLSNYTFSFCLTGLFSAITSIHQIRLVPEGLPEKKVGIAGVRFLQAISHSCHLTNIVKALKVIHLLMLK